MTDTGDLMITGGLPRVERWNGEDWRPVELAEYAVKCRVLAEWFDAYDDRNPAELTEEDRAVQRDLRELARILEILGDR